jgi:outer membrane biosynthesis protein TonB
MYRVIAVVAGGLLLAACSTSSDWLDALKPAPILDTVRFETTPPGAEAKTTDGQTCRTPCALALPVNAPITVTFTLTGYLPDTENIEPISNGTSQPDLRPNPVQVELTPAPPPPKPVKKPVHKRKAAKPKPKAKPKTSAAPPAAPPAPAQQPAPAPWPAAPPPKQ